ncbi:hypothetical protein CHS0354_042490 [Potamilus streckersoni]|uniref:Hypoxia up-regulated protein 1 n=1 Tax=Potamilus streckersoni TaxID=2493646 RepID=A0AAE0S9M0_9BIVA|nr:hypothetical protein CHS0354_042490 [Potamilus streckersoni]
MFKEIPIDMILKMKLVSIATILVGLFSHTVARLAVMSVDLGSEYMKVAIVKPGVPMEIVLDTDSARKTASVIVIRDGERFYGNAAENLAVRFPNRGFWYLTHIIGKKFEDPQVAKFQKRFHYFNMIKDEERGTVLFKVDDETTYSPEELLGMLLERAKHYAENFAAQPVKDCVITVPPYFNQAERRSILYAAELGGLNVLQLISDNAAVALNYGVFRRKMFNSTMQYYVFYDMGATKTTATVVGYQVVQMKEGTRAENNPQLVIKGVGYDRDLGGLEFSMRLRDHLARIFNSQKKTKTDVFTNPRAMAKLFKEAHRVKKILSANNDHMAQVEGLLDEQDFKTRITRAEFEEMCADLFERVTRPLEEALKVSEVTLGEITEVILMGGSTRIPKVQDLLMKYIGRSELGKSINTDEAAAMGAVYQAAYLGKGFKVKTFSVKEGNIYPIVVEFEKHHSSEESSESGKVIKRTLFGRMNPYPQRKVMTFNKHLKDFNFNVSYGDLSFLSQDEAALFAWPLLHQVNLTGVAEAYSKHTDNVDSKGIKAHFRMDESGFLKIETVEAVFEKIEEEKAEESTWSRIGDRISGLFGSSEGKDAEAKPTESSEGKKEEEGSNQTSADQTSSDQSESEETGSTEKPAEDVGTEEDQKSEGDQKQEEKKKEKDDSQEDEQKETTEKEKEGKKEEEKKEEKKEEPSKKLKQVVIKENITFDSEVKDILMPSKENTRHSKKKLADWTAKDNEKAMLEKSKNELEAFIYDMTDKLSQTIYEKHSTQEERDSISQELASASDWLSETDMDTTKEAYTDKLRSLKKLTKDLSFRVKEATERPKALDGLKFMLNHSEYFVKTVKNLTELEDPILTATEVETLEKLINNTKEWRANMLKEQGQTKPTETPKILIADIADKIADLDREIKYLINKAKHFKPKPKEKSGDTKSDTNETVIEEETIANETKEAKDSANQEDGQYTEQDFWTEGGDQSEGDGPSLDTPPAEESTDKENEVPILELGDGKTTGTEKPSKKEKEKSTHDPTDL